MPEQAISAVAFRAWTNKVEELEKQVIALRQDISDMRVSILHLSHDRTMHGQGSYISPDITNAIIQVESEDE